MNTLLEIIYYSDPSISIQSVQIIDQKCFSSCLCMHEYLRLYVILNKDRILHCYDLVLLIPLSDWWELMSVWYNDVGLFPMFKLFISVWK